MAAERSLFDKEDLSYIAGNLFIEAANPETVLPDGTVTFPQEPWPWEGFESVVANSRKFRTVTVPKGSGKEVTAQMLVQSENMRTIKKKSPVFIFVTVPDSMTDPRRALRCLLCTLIYEISGYIINVPPEKMAEEGVLGGRFVLKCIDSERGHSGYDNDGIRPLIKLLSALRHCDFETDYKEETNAGALRMKYVYIIVVEGLKRIAEEAGPGYYPRVKNALKHMLRAKMRGHIVYVDEGD